MIVFKAQLYYHLREKHWKTAMTLCEDEMKKGRDPLINFYRSLCYFKSGSIIDAIRDCKMSQNSKDLKYSSTAALIYFHEQSSSPDNQEISNLVQLLDRFKSEIKGVSSTDVLHLMRFFTYLDELDKYFEAEDIFDKMVNNSDGEDMIVKGWNLCFSDNPEEIESAHQLFDKYIQEYGSNNLDATMGKLKSLERLKKNEEVLDGIALVYEQAKNFPPLIIEKCKIYMNLSEYDGVMDYIRSDVRINHFEISRIMALCQLIHEGNFKDASSSMEKMWVAMTNQEPNNPELFYQTALLFSRVCDRSPSVITKCESMVDKSITFNPRSAKYTLEKGYYKLLQGDLTSAERLIAEAISMNPQYKESEIKFILLKITQGDIGDAKSRIQNLKEYYQSANLTPLAELLYYETYLEIREFLNSAKKSTAEDKKLYTEQIEKEFSTKLGDVLSKHIAYAKQFYFSKYDIITATNYDFLCDIARLCSDFYSINGDVAVDQKNVPGVLQRAKKILDSIIGDKNKYFISAMLLNCKLKYLLGDKQNIVTQLEAIIKVNPSSYLDAYILFAILMNECKDFVKSKEVIQNALLNCSAKAKINIHFWIAKINIDLGLNDFVAAENSLKEAIKLSKTLIGNEGQKSKQSKESISILNSSIFEFKKSDNSRLIILQIELCLRQDKIQEAQELINKLLSEGIDMADNILLLNAEIALKTGNVKNAVSLLKKIKPEPSNQDVYIESRTKLGEIYLNHLIDRRLYSWCYSEILDNYYSLANLKLAAVAEIRIDSPSTAVKYYEEALKITPEDLSVIRDLGNALILTHDYGHAESFFEDSISSFKSKLTDKNIESFYDLVENYSVMLKKLGSNDLKKYSSLIKFLEDTIQILKKHIQTYSDLQFLKRKFSRLLFILATTSRLLRSKEPTATVSNIAANLEEANKVNKELISKMKDKKQELIANEIKNFMSEVSYEQGKYFETIESNFENAEKFYLDALSHSNNTSEVALSALVNICLKLQKLNDAQKHADMLIRLNENSEENIGLLITVISNRKKNEEASQYLEQIILKQLTSFKLVEVYIELVRRTGKIYKAKEIIAKCEKKLKYTYSPGLIYCKGLYLRYTNETNLALNEFIKIKTDEYYGVKCIEQMLELYINPDNNILLLELGSPFALNSNQKGNDILFYNTSDINFDAVKFLVKELTEKRDDDNSKIYECWARLLVRDQKFVLNVIEKAQDILSKDSENLSAWVLLAFANILIGRESEAKNNLKFLDKPSISNIRYYSEYERGYLLLAYMSMKAGNIPKASEYLKKITNELNIAQIQAYEFFGIIFEKENNFKEACNYFEKAWEFSIQNNAKIGYKLAVCYLNNRNPIKAVNICNEVIKKYPNYPITELCAKAKTYLS